ncbi:hypothetical protein RJ639_024808 [Escallonia herrerae]|uniref:MEKHLA domain-containing protein n=1 Tax=Escallonia herrerae TaxID=1293975 RepID=A0AA88S2L3_9ASTE|nr:hypothetical protein RJ639_024808 [Escallonia herrerae]
MTKLTELVLLEGGRELVMKVVTMLKFLQADGWWATLESIQDKFSLAEDLKNKDKLKKMLVVLVRLHNRLLELEAKLEGRKLFPRGGGDNRMPVKRGEDDYEEKPGEDADEGESFASFHLWEPVFTFGNQAGLDMLETTLVALQDTAWQNL